MAGSITATGGRIPQSLEAERAVLGAMILEGERISEVIELIPKQARVRFHIGVAPRPRRSRPEPTEPLFSSTVNQEVFEVIVSLHEREHKIDLTVLGEELDRLGRYEGVGGGGYLASLVEDLGYELLTPEYVRVVVDKWRLRSLLGAAERIKSEVSQPDCSVSDVIDDSQRWIFEVSQQIRTSDFEHVGEQAAANMNEIEQRIIEGTRGIVGLSTGFTDLDRLTSGFRKENLIILAARPSVGKSALALNMAKHAAVNHNLPVGFFALEMSTSELTQRLLCTLAGVPLNRVRMNTLSAQDIDRLHEQTIRLNNTPLYIDDTPALTILEMRGRAQRLKEKCPSLALIVVDYLQLMRATTQRSENRQQEVSEISRALKAMARELDVPVLALSQLSRQVEQRQGRGSRDKMPKLSDLRESGGIEQDADVVMFIHRDFAPKGDDPGGGPGAGEADLATLRVAKQRNGPVGDLDLFFKGDVTEFRNVAPGARGRA